MDWIDLVQDMDQPRAPVNMVMNLWVPQDVGNWRLLRKGSAPWS
jgi:hypothetical protein